MSVSRTTCIVSVLVVGLLISGGIGLAVWFLNVKGNRKTENSIQNSSTIEPIKPIWPVEFPTGLIVRTNLNVQAYASMNSSNSVQLLSKPVTSVDFYKNNTLYYAGSGNNEPVRSTSDQYPSLKYPGEYWYVTVLAIDFVTEKVYVYDHQVSKIEMYDMHGKYMGIIFTEMNNCLDLTLDLLKGYLFILQSSKILLASMDGVDVKEIIRDDNILSFALDTQQSFLYYSKVNMIMVHDYIISHSTYQYTRIDETSTIFSLAISKGILYYLYKDEEKSFTTLNTCELDSPSLTGKCVNSLNGIIKDNPRQIKTFDLLQEPIDNPCHQMNGGCQHLCVLSARLTTGQNYSCQCHLGFQLNSDGKTCSPVKEYFLYIRDFYLKGRILDLKKKSFVDVFQPMRLILNSVHSVEFDFNVRKGYAVYSDGSDIWRLNFLRSKGQRLLLLEEDNQYLMLYPTIDWLTNQLYYLRRHILDNSSSYVMVRHSDNIGGLDDQKILYQIPDNGKPQAMVLSVNLGLIFFTVVDANHNAVIYRMSLNGRDLEKFAINEKNFSVSAYGLAFDDEKQKIYWFNADRTQIQYATWNGKELNTIDISKFQNPLRMTIHQQWIYIGLTHSVQRLHKETGDDAQHVLPQVSESYSEGMSLIKLFSEAAQPIDYNNPCALNRGGCQEYCFAVRVIKEVSTFEKVCGCKANQELQDDKTTCKSKQTV